MPQATVLEVTDPFTGYVMPLIAKSLDEAMQMQGLLWMHLDVQTDIVFAGVDPEQLTVSDEQNEVLQYILLCLDDELKRQQKSIRNNDFSEYGANVVSLCDFRSAKIERDFVLTFD